MVDSIRLDPTNTIIEISCIDEQQDDATPAMNRMLLIAYGQYPHTSGAYSRKQGVSYQARISRQRLDDGTGSEYEKHIKDVAPHHIANSNIAIVFKSRNSRSGQFG